MVSRKSEDILVVFQTGQHDLYFVSVCLVEICQIYIFLWGGGGDLLFAHLKMLILVCFEYLVVLCTEVQTTC